MKYMCRPEEDILCSVAVCTLDAPQIYGEGEVVDLRGYSHVVLGGGG